MSANGNEREELAQVAASLRAYLEWQLETGAVGIPRRAVRPAKDAVAAAGARTGGEGTTGQMGAAAAQAGRSSSEVTPDEYADAATVVEAPAPVTQVSPTFARASVPVLSSPTPLASSLPTLPGPESWASSPSGSSVSSKLAGSVSPPTSTSTSTSASASGSASAPSSIALDPAARAARLPVLAQEVASCTRCELSLTRTQTVFARGNPRASLCFIGEAPGADEDAQGLPFVGKAGQLLDRMIAAMGLNPASDVYVCNIIKCRPPGNRRPTPEEMNLCIPYLHEQMALVGPKVIVAMGNTAVSALLNTNLGITKLRGQWKLYRATTLVMPTYHPSYLLRPSDQQADAKRQAWEDLQAVMKELNLPLPARR